MQAVILAAGRGKRMMPLTKNTPKALLTIAGLSLIEHNILKLTSANISKIIINTHYLSAQIIQKLANKYSYIYFSQEVKKLESGGAILNIINKLDDIFIILNADIMHNYDLTKLQLPAKSLAHLILIDNPQHNKDGDFYFKNKKLTFSGIGIYSKKLFTKYNQGYIKLATIIQDNLNEISFEHHSGMWIDVGTIDRLKQARLLFDK